MAESEKSSGNVIKYIVIPVISVGLTLATMAIGRSDRKDDQINEVRTELRSHQDNSRIHRTAEEAEAVLRGEQAWKEMLMDRLKSIDARLEKLENRK